MFWHKMKFRMQPFGWAIAMLVHAASADDFTDVFLEQKVFLNCN